MTSEATRKRIEAILKESWNSKDWKTGYKVGAKEFHDIGYNQAIEDALKEIQWSNITYEVKGNLMEKLRLFKLKSSQDEK